MAFHPLALGVEEVGDAVQRHHRLPRPGPPTITSTPGWLGADDLVLFGLDRHYDVAHALAARRVDRRKQGVV